jgi:hypothetical protein
VRLLGLEDPLDAIDPLLHALGDLPQFGEHELLAVKPLKSNTYSFRACVSGSQEELQNLALVSDRLSY